MLKESWIVQSTPRQLREIAQIFRQREKDRMIDTCAETLKTSESEKEQSFCVFLKSEIISKICYFTGSWAGSRVWGRPLFVSLCSILLHKIYVHFPSLKAKKKKIIKEKDVVFQTLTRGPKRARWDVALRKIIISGTKPAPAQSLRAQGLRHVGESINNIRK